MTPAQTEEDDFDLAAQIRLLWQKRLLIAACIGGAVLVAIFYLHIVQYTYTATLGITAVPSSGNSSALNQNALSGIASAVGLGPSQGNSAITPFQLYVEGIHTHRLADEMAKHADLMKIIFSAEWDEAGQQWHEPSGSVRTVIKLIKTVLGMSAAWQAPDGARLQEYISQTVTVEQNSKKPVSTVSFSHPDPAFALKFLRVLNQAVDNQVRQTAAARATEYIRFLSDKLNVVTVAEHRAAITQALLEQERTLMMTSSPVPFAADPFDGPVVSRRPTNPQPIKIMMGYIFGGLLVGIIAVFVRARFYNHAVINFK